MNHLPNHSASADYQHDHSDFSISPQSWQAYEPTNPLMGYRDVKYVSLDNGRLPVALPAAASSLQLRHAPPTAPPPAPPPASTARTTTHSSVKWVYLNLFHCGFLWRNEDPLLPLHTSFDQVLTRHSLLNLERIKMTRDFAVVIFGAAQVLAMSDIGSGNPFIKIVFLSARLCAFVGCLLEVMIAQKLSLYHYRTVILDKDCGHWLWNVEILLSLGLSYTAWACFYLSIAIVVSSVTHHSTAVSSGHSSPLTIVWVATQAVVAAIFLLLVTLDSRAFFSRGQDGSVDEVVSMDRGWLFQAFQNFVEQTIWQNQQPWNQIHHDGIAQVQEMDPVESGLVHRRAVDGGMEHDHSGPGVW